VGLARPAGVPRRPVQPARGRGHPGRRGAGGATRCAAWGFV